MERALGDERGTTERVLTLLGLLQQRPAWTGPELADRLGVTPRTVRRDVERLRTLDLAKAPGVAETLDWTQALVALELAGSRFEIRDRTCAEALSALAAILHGKKPALG